MSTQKPSKRELIKQIASDVEDPKLREQLIDALLDQEESSHNRWDSGSHMAVHPDAVPSNVRLQKSMIVIAGVVLFLWLNSWANGTPRTETGYSMLRFASFFLPFIFLLKYIHLSNITKWQRRDRKQPRKFWGAMIQPPVDEK